MVKTYNIGIIILNILYSEHYMGDRKLSLNSAQLYFGSFNPVNYPRKL